MESVQTQTPTQEGNRPPTDLILKLIQLHGYRADEKSYITKAVRTLPHLTENFTVPEMARKADIPRSKGYPAIKALQDLGLVETIPKIHRPDDWDDYSLSMRKRFYSENGLPKRGMEPQRYKFSRLRAVMELRDVVRRRILEIDEGAFTETARLMSEYHDIVSILL